MNWEERIQRAKKSKIFTQEDKELGRLWVTGPLSEISELTDKIELRCGDLKQGPTDIYLILDGIYFSKGIEEDNVDLAENCYYAIVKQIGELAAGTDRITGLKRFLGKHYK